MLLYELMQGVTVGDPTDQTGVLTQGYDWVAADRQILLRSLRVNREQGVYQPKKLHHTLILPDVLVTLQEEHVLTAIASVDLHLPGVLFGREYWED